MRKVNRPNEIYVVEYISTREHPEPYLKSTYYRYSRESNTYSSPTDKRNKNPDQLPKVIQKKIEKHDGTMKYKLSKALTNEYGTCIIQCYIYSVKKWIFTLYKHTYISSQIPADWTPLFSCPDELLALIYFLNNPADVKIITGLEKRAYVAQKRRDPQAPGYYLHDLFQAIDSYTQKIYKNPFNNATDAKQAAATMYRLKELLKDLQEAGECTEKTDITVPVLMALHQFPQSDYGIWELLKRKKFIEGFEQGQHTFFGSGDKSKRYFQTLFSQLRTAAHQVLHSLLSDERKALERLTQSYKSQRPGADSVGSSASTLAQAVNGVSGGNFAGLDDYAKQVQKSQENQPSDHQQPTSARKNPLCCCACLAGLFSSKSRPPSRVSRTHRSTIVTTHGSVAQGSEHLLSGEKPGYGS